MANLRIEYRDAEFLIAGVTLAVTASATSGGSRPVVPAGQNTGNMVARFTADAPVYVGIGPFPNPASSEAFLVYPGIPLEVAVNSGHLISAVTASDISAPVLGALAASAAVIGKVDHTTTGIGHGVKVVAAAGTDVALAASTAAKWVVVQAQTDNTGVIAVGATGVDATVATGNGVALAAGESITLPVDNLADVFIDATVTGDGVRFTYGT